MKTEKPLGYKSYGSIPHLKDSRVGPGDHFIDVKQAELLINPNSNRKQDLVYLSEKLDGSNVGVTKINGEIIPLVRAGYTALSSPYKQHHIFYEWVMKRKKKFYEALDDRERMCGEWLYQVHGTKYDIKDPEMLFAPFDLYNKNNKRVVYEELIYTSNKLDFIMPKIVHVGKGISISEALKKLGTYGFHNALDPIEGGVWRLEDTEKNKFSTIAKFVNHFKQDGVYMNEDLYNYKGLI